MSLKNWRSNALLRFLIVGGVSALFLFAFTLAFQRWGGLPAWAAYAVSYLITFGGTYAFQRNWAFESDASHSETLPRYATTQLLCMLITMGVVRLFEGFAPEADHTISSLVATICSASTGFVLSSRWVFAKRSAAR